jgi:hypothetical protein
MAAPMAGLKATVGAGRRSLTIENPSKTVSVESSDSALFMPSAERQGKRRVRLCKYLSGNGLRQSEVPLATGRVALGQTLSNQYFLSAINAPEAESGTGGRIKIRPLVSS